jgi:two-component system phosphate regulon response regulator PhoB
MPTREDIADQQKLLAIHRRTLAVYLSQEAAMGSVHVPPSIVNGISQARASIQHIKENLQEWGAAVEDHPDDKPHTMLPTIEALAKARQAMEKQDILLIEDTKAHAQNIKDRLEWLGYAIAISYTGESGLSAAKEQQPDLVILDIMLETDDKGFDVIRKLQADPKTQDIPIIVYSITAKEMENRLRGFALGALWYLDRNEGITELEAIVRRALALQQRQRRDQTPNHRIPLDFDNKTGTVWIDGRATDIKLPPLQADLLALLVERSGQICERDEIASRVYKANQDSVSNASIDRLVSRLRAILGDNPGNPRLIESVRGKGYRLLVAETHQR